MSKSDSLAKPQGEGCEDEDQSKQARGKHASEDISEAGFRSRFDPTSFLLTDAALVHPGHKSLSWLTPREQANAIEQFKEELLNIAGVDKEPLQTNMPSAMEHCDHGSISDNRIPLDSYFDFEASQFNAIINII